MIALGFEVTDVNYKKFKNDSVAKGYVVDDEGSDAVEVVFMPTHVYQILTEIATEHSLMLAAEGKNIHGLERVR